MDTLAFGYILPTTGWIRDFNPLETCAAGRTIKAVFWWCYRHSPEPLSASELLKVMPTDKSIAAIYQKMNEKKRLEKSLSVWGDAIVWSELHNVDKTFNDWD